MTKIEKINYLLILLSAGLHFSSITYFWKLPEFILSKGGDTIEVGIVLGMMIFPMILFLPLTGAWSDKNSPKLLTLSGFIFVITCNFGFIWIERPGLFVYILRIGQGIGHSLVFASLLSILSKIIPENNKAQGLSYYVLVIQLSNALGSFISNKVVNLGYNWFFILASLTSFLGLISMSFVKSNPLWIKPKGEKFQSKKWAQVVFHQKYLVGFSLIFVLGGTFGSIILFTEVYFKNLLTNNLVEESINPAYFISSALFVVALSRLFLGKKVDKINKVKLISYNLFVFALSVFFISMIRSPLSAVMIASFFGLTYGVLYPVLAAQVLMRTELPHRGKISGMLAMFFEVGFAGFSFLIGPLVKNYGFFTIFYILPGLILFVLILFIITERKEFRKKDIDTYLSKSSE